jgi:hypothetical protein
LSGSISPGSTIRIDIKIHVDRITAIGLNTKSTALEDIIILHTENGQDSFISVSCPWSFSCYGMRLSTLVKLAQPVRKYSETELMAISRGEREAELNFDFHAISGAMTDIAKVPLFRSSLPPSEISVPKEILRLADYIFKNGIGIEDLFIASTGDTQMCQYFRDCLDTGDEFDPHNLEAYQAIFLSKGQNIAVYSAVSCLIQLLEALESPLIPPVINERCILEGSHSLQAAQSIIQNLPLANYVTFLFLMDFFSQMLRANSAEKSRFAEAIASILLNIEYKPEVADTYLSSWFYGKPSNPTASINAWNKKRCAFIAHFL